METVRSRNLPKNTAENIVSKWKEYRDAFGFEAEIAKTLEKQGFSKEKIDEELENRRKIIQDLWKK